MLIFCSSLQLSPIRVNAYHFTGAGLLSSPFSTDAQFIPPITQVDLDGNGVPENIVINNDQAFLISNGQYVWESPSDWQVLQTLISDLDQDDKPEITLLIRRPFHPWPVDQWLPFGGRIEDFQDSSGMSCHIIMIGWKDERYKEIWAGSSLSQPALSIAAADLDQDGQIELITMEGVYDERSVFPGKTLKLWEWNGFGFSLLTSLPGKYNNFMIFTSRSKQSAITIITY